MITMINYIDIFKKMEDGFLSNKGRAFTSVYYPITWYKAIATIIIKLLNKRPECNILLVIPFIEERKDIYKTFAEANIDTNKTLIITSGYYNTFKDKATTVIIVDADISLIDKCLNNQKFILYINTKSKLSIKDVNLIKTKLPYFDLGITAQQLSTSRVNTPVKEWRHEVTLSDTDRELYNKYDDYIKDSMKIFGDFNTIERCRIGDRESGMSAFDCCLDISYRNGWNKELDMSVEYNVQIDKFFNPTTISERATTVFNITRDRKNLLLNNKNKFTPILNICKDNQNKKILIVSKNGDFANELFQFLIDNELCVGQFHNDVPASYLYDENNDIITYKTGENKGKPKLFKSAAISTSYKNWYNSNIINILIIKEASDVNLAISADIVIFTSTLLNNIFDFKKRYKYITYPSDYTILHRIYTKDTLEETTMYRDMPTNLIELQNKDYEKSLQIDDETGEINV